MKTHLLSILIAVFTLFMVNVHAQEEVERVPYVNDKGESKVRSTTTSYVLTSDMTTWERLLDENKNVHYYYVRVRYSMLPYKEQGQMTNVPLYAV